MSKTQTAQWRKGYEAGYEAAFEEARQRLLSSHGARLEADLLGRPDARLDALERAVAPSNPQR